MKKKLLALLGLLFLLSCASAHATQYVNSVTQGSVTIASGSLTGTSSAIGAPTGTYVLFYGGCTTSAVTSNGQAYGRIAVSQSTGVVTATRGVSSTTTVTCTYSIMDATANLVTSVQQGSTTLSLTAGTGVSTTISSVTTVDSSVMYEGMSQTLTTQHFDLNTYGVTLLDATHVSAVAINNGSGTTIGGWTVVNWNHAALQSSTQQFVKSWTDTSGSSTTQALTTAVTLANSMCIFGGGGSPNGNTNVREQPTIQLTGTSTVTITMGDTANGNTQKAYGTVVEFITGVLQQTAQRGTITLNAANSNTASITSSPITSSILNYNGFLSTNATNTTHTTLLPSETFTNATTITANTNANATGMLVGYEALNFQNTGAGGSPTYPGAPDGFMFPQFPF